jgi:predicted  nucleic acid-binding Zn-ribbon protein
MPMPQQTLARRVERLEEAVENLQRLPEQVDSLGVQQDRLEAQIVQLRDEMPSEFSAVRAEMRAGDEETRRLMRVLHEDVIARIALLDNGRR